MMHIQEALEIAEENLQRYEIPPDKVGFFQRLCEHPETVEVLNGLEGVKQTSIICLICGNDLFPF
jgi:hypothetical protein